jgi:aarF domain-containing kinase
MISRVALVTLSSHKYRQKQVLYHASTLSAMGLAGIALHSNFQTTKMDGTKFDTSLVVPTIEAATRALNLVSTAFLMIADYEYAKFSDRFFPDDDPERRFWLKEKERRQRELEEAQRMFTAPKQDKLIEKSGKRRTMYFRDGKKLVYHAAQRLAEAEEKLAILGDPHSQVHRKAATRLLNLCRKNGGVYIKVGQHIANLDYLIPPEYIEVLSSLFDDAPQSSYSNVCKVIQEDLGKHPDELFESFEKTPIASASLAQVHVAYEKGTGKKLAIKCQHRGLRESSSGDIFAVVTVIQTIESMFKDFTFGWIADEIAPHLPIELDFVNEGKNAERAASFIAKSGLPCVIPKILWDKTSRRVLCMEFEEGFKSTDLSAIEKSGLKKRDIATLIASVFSSQVFTPDSNIHVDPHPANVLIREHKGKPLMVLVDHGLYKSIDNKFRMEYAKLWKSMMLADLDGIKETSKNLGVEEMVSVLCLNR